MKTQTKWMVAGLGAVAIGVPFAFAQNMDPDMTPPMPPMQPGGMMMQGPPVMTGDNTHLYILRGDQLLKVSKADLKVVAQTMLPSNRRGMGPGMGPGMGGPNNGQGLRRRANPPGGGAGQTL